MGVIFWLSIFAQEMKEKIDKDTELSEILHAGVIKPLFCALNINE